VTGIVGEQKAKCQDFCFACFPLYATPFHKITCTPTRLPRRGRRWKMSFVAHEFTASYLQDALSLFRYYKKLGERAMEQCPDDCLFVALDDESNSIAIIVKHLVGNMRSRWRNFLTSDGEKPDRHRDSEFEDAPKSRAELMAMWGAGWKYVFDALESLTDEDLTRTVTIRAEPHSVMQAINRQLAHYPHHIGQILFVAKHLTSARTGKWTSLSVPRGHSAQFTADVASGKKSQR
jgi:hypothetical protein